jgi:hypothetical protein
MTYETVRTAHVRHCATHGDYSDAGDECPRCRLMPKREKAKRLELPTQCPKCDRWFTGKSHWLRKHMEVCHVSDHTRGLAALLRTERDALAARVAKLDAAIEALG